MATGRIRRTARRGIALAVLTWLGVAAASVGTAPAAQAAPTATVPIRDLTQLVVSVDEGGTVTFVNELQDKQLKVGGNLLPALVDVTAKTEVTLTLPSGQKPLAPGASVTEKFDRSCVVGCWLTFTYKYESRAALTQPLIDATAKLLPPLPRPQPLVVNTLLPLPNLPGVNLPQLPPLALPETPQVIPNPAPAPNGGPVPPPAAAPPAPAGGPVLEGTPGTQYQYPLGDAGAARLAPGTRAGIAAFDPSRFFIPGTSFGSADRVGSGGVAGSYDGASVPVFGQLAGLDGAALDEENSAETVNASAAEPVTLPAAALAAVVALAAVTAALVRTHQASRGTR
ncbi:hypothetical protein [Blastococcus sp. TF02A-35]|uniref:hypothetical protein n=1 Tax=Blastococcus sp. TF02A-35 TaxID=2559612 RepID=UPI00107493D1|nr:hypothetical protein [Blastococcus sp. TF02A_35]TFV51772.1 hypothetical protein E4P43_08820 [Blastococcus sp. TF02A_35]